MQWIKSCVSTTACKTAGIEADHRALQNGSLCHRLCVQDMRLSQPGHCYFLCSVCVGAEGPGQLGGKDEGGQLGQKDCWYFRWTEGTNFTHSIHLLSVPFKIRMSGYSQDQWVQTGFHNLLWGEGIWRWLTQICPLREEMPRINRCMVLVRCNLVFQARLQIKYYLTIITLWTQRP